MVPNGEGVFETLKVVDSKPHALTRHLARLSRSAAALGLESPDVSEIRRAVESHLEGAPWALGRMRLTWTAAPDGAALSLDSAPLAAPRPSATLALSDWCVDERSPLAGLKTTSYVDYSAALHAAQAKGFDEALLANSSGEMCEATTANIFYVIDGTIHTPATTAGCLPGIARDLVLELRDVVEVRAPVSVFAEATEVFLTSSLREIQPVSRIDAVYYPVGPVTVELADAWRRMVGTTSDP